MHGEYKIPGGKLVVVDLDVVDGRLRQVQVSGDFFLEPDSAFDAMNASLQGLLVGIDEAALAAAVHVSLGSARMYGLTAEGVAIAVRRALAGGADA